MKKSKNLKSFYFTLEKSDYIVMLEYLGVNKIGVPKYKAFIISIDTANCEQKTTYLLLNGHFLPENKEAEMLIKAYHQTKKTRA